MGWIEVIVGAIILASWIASNIREMQKAAAANAAPPIDDAPPAGAPPRETDDLKDFLKQVRRRMGEPEPQQQPERAGRDVLVEDPRQIEPPRWEAPPPTKAKSKKKRQPEPASGVVRTAEVTALSADFAKPSTTSGPILGGSRRKVPSPIVGEVVNLLKSPSGLSTAFLLREILSEPMCKRRPESRRKGL